MINAFNRALRHRATATGILLAASLMVLSACNNTLTPEQEANVTTEELAEGTEGLVGQEVSVRSEVEQIVGDDAFLIDDDRLLGGDDILVINATGEPFTLIDGDDTDVQVTGTVQNFDTAALSEEYNLVLESDVFADYEGRPAVIAESLALSPDPGDVTSDPDKYYNKQIAIQGEINEELSPTSFTLAEHQLFNNEDLLVITPAAAPITQTNEEVVVTGVLRPYIEADFERDYDLNWDLSTQEQIEAEYSEKPVFVADSVYTSAIAPGNK
ncbi:MAG: hypothetical protein AAF716_22685 [Cyanobacteria bacterium P01_D01_bin.1]